MSLSLFTGKAQPAQQVELITVSIEGCAPASGGVGLDLNLQNIVLELRSGCAAEQSGKISVGDRIVSVDGTKLDGKPLTDVIQPAESHEFELERFEVGWAGFSTEAPASMQDEAQGELDHFRTVMLQKANGQVGINPEVFFPDGETEVLKIARVYKGSVAAAGGVITPGDRIAAINGTRLAGGGEGGVLKQAMDELSQIPDGVDIALELESDTLLAGWMQKKGEKGLKSWQRRFFTLVWSELNLAEREIRYYEGRDSATRKQKGAIDLTRCSSVEQTNVDGGAGINIQTPGRLWELLPETASEAQAWYRLLNQLLARSKGFAVVASMSNAAAGLDEDDEPEIGRYVSRPGQGELTVMLQRKLGLSINKMGQEIVIAQIEPDGAAAGCGLLSLGDAIVAVNGTECTACKQTIKMLTENAGACTLNLCSKVVHGGWMHKLGEGLGGWTTRYFTLGYELETGTAQAHAIMATQRRARQESRSDMAKKTRQRAASSAADPDGNAAFAIRLHKPTPADKLGLGLVESSDSKVVIERIYSGFVAANSGSLIEGDVLVSVNGEAVEDRDQALRLLLEASGNVDIKVERKQDPGCWMLRYYDGKNSVTRASKGCIRLDKKSIREINKYTLQEEDTADGVPRVGLYILQDDRCWELLPPEEELDSWISSLQLAVFGQEVISGEHVTPDGQAAAAAKVRALKGSRSLKLLQQYGLVLATYNEAPREDGTKPVHIMSFEADGAGACCGMLRMGDIVLEVDGDPAESLQQVTKAFQASRHAVRVKVESKIAHGGFMLKKGEVNQQFQLRWFLLVDEGEEARLIYFDQRNVVSRAEKGVIKISQREVSAVKQFSHENPVTGEKQPGIAIHTEKRKFELLCETTPEARLWTTMLQARIRPKRRSIGPGGLIAEGSRSSGIMPDGPKSTRL